MQGQTQEVFREQLCRRERAGERSRPHIREMSSCMVTLRYISRYFAHMFLPSANPGKRKNCTQRKVPGWQKCRQRTEDQRNSQTLYSTLASHFPEFETSSTCPTSLPPE